MKKCIMNLCKKSKKNDKKNDIIIENNYISYKLTSIIEPQECVICLENMNNNDIIVLTECFHMYHKKCINDWFMISNICPICDKKIL